MSKLQSNFTTIELSKRLLELGVPADSADCWICIDKSDFTYTVKVFHSHNYSYIENYYNEMNRKEEMHIDILPCWSVGRLIEIMKICNHADDVDEVFCELAYSKKNIVELIVRLMEENKEITDFSKLEE